MTKKIFDINPKIPLRDIFGYLLFFALLLFLVLFYFTQIPTGLSAAEMTSATISGNLTLSGWIPDQIIDLPYQFIQWLSFNIFDVSVFSIKLPSILMAILTGTMVLFIVRELYNSKVAILTGLIVISSVLFISLGRTGAPLIMPIFLSIVAMFATSRALRKTKHDLRWLILAGVALALNIYSPMGIYLTVILIGVAMFHPKVRFILSKSKLWKTIVTAVVLLLLITPLIIGIVRDPSVVMQLLGISNFSFALSDIKDNALAIFWPMGGEFTGIATPLLTMSLVAFMALGVVGAVDNFHSVRSYLSIPLFGVILILSLFNSNAAPLLLVPVILLTAIGINYLLNWWFMLFPRNPYAKAIGVIPLAILFGWVILSGSTRYFETNFYDKNLAYDFYSGFDATKEAVDGNEKKILIVSKDQLEVDFYRTAFNSRANVTVSGVVKPGVDKIILLPSAFDEIKDKKPSRIVTNRLRNDSEILRVFNTPTN